MENDKKWILVVDDIEMIRVSVTCALEPEYYVITAANGKEAYELLEKYKTEVSFVLTDIIMPEMDGFELIRAMKENTNLQDIPIMVFTADHASEMIAEAIALGALDIINKPLDPEILRARVGNILDRE